jgi:hypothetical protein
MKMKKYNEDGTIEISGQDLLSMQLVVDDFDVEIAAGQAARRVEAAKLHKQGLSWSKARKQAADAKPTPEMFKIVRLHLGRGGNHESAVQAAMAAAGLRIV